MLRRNIHKNIINNATQNEEANCPNSDGNDSNTESENEDITAHKIQDSTMSVTNSVLGKAETRTRTPQPGPKSTSRNRAGKKAVSKEDKHKAEVVGIVKRKPQQYLQIFNEGQKLEALVLGAEEDLDLGIGIGDIEQQSPKSPVSAQTLKETCHLLSM